MFDRLKEARISRNVTCEDLSALLGFQTRGAYHKKESGNVPFTLNEAKVIAAYFNMPIEEVFFENEVSNKETVEPDDASLEETA